MTISRVRLVSNRFVCSCKRPRLSVLAFLASVAACLSTCPADAGVLVSWSEVGGNFQGVVSGSLTSAELAQAGSNFASTLSDTAFIDTTPTFASYPAGTHLRYNFLASTVAFTPDFIRLNSYVGTSRSGDVFGFYQVANGSLTVTVPSGYQAGTAINGTLTVPAYGNSLSTSFTMGEVIKLNGNALVTFSAAAVPEPSTVVMALAGLTCGGFLMRRRIRRRTSGQCVAAIASLALVGACVATGSAHAAPIAINWVTVGDPGNAADTSGSPSPAGAVAESFKIMKYEFTNSQYATFLNAVDPGGSNPLGLYAGGYGSGVDYRYGIQWQSGASGTHYVVRNNFGDKPVTFVSWFDAARVANWLHNNGAYGSTETGAYTLVGYQTSGTAPARNPGARYFIPTENEWYKAAYYKGGGTNAGYWDYATQSNTAPSAVTADSTGIGSAGSTGNFANYGYGAPWSGGSPNVTTVGTNGGPSAYGAFDMGGNVFELNDLTGGAGSTRGYRGGDFLYSANALAAWGRYTAAPDFQDGYIGFRLAAIVPEPSTVAMALAGLACGGLFLRRRKRA